MYMCSIKQIPLQAGSNQLMVAQNLLSHDNQQLIAKGSAAVLTTTVLLLAKQKIHDDGFVQMCFTQTIVVFFMYVVFDLFISGLFLLATSKFSLTTHLSGYTQDQFSSSLVLLLLLLLLLLSLSIVNVLQSYVKALRAIS